MQEASQRYKGAGILRKRKGRATGPPQVESEFPTATARATGPPQVESEFPTATAPTFPECSDVQHEDARGVSPQAGLRQRL